MSKVYGYTRVSSRGQVENGSGLDRQNDSILSYVKSQKLKLDHIFVESGVSGTIEHREELNNLLIICKPSDTVIIEGLDRLSRDLMIQETIIQKLKSKKVNLISLKEGSDLLDENPSRQMIRQIIGSVIQYDKSNLVERLKVSRDRIKRETGKCEGRKSYSEVSPETVQMIKTLSRKHKGMKKPSYQSVSDELNSRGFVTLSGKPFSKERVYSIVKNNL